MAGRLVVALLLAALTAGCSSVREAYGTQTVSATSFRHAYGIQDGLAYAPPMDRKRNVFEQDCSKPVALDRGNLRCK
jgi:hypothetical protein